MSVRITCPDCEASYSVDDDRRGKKVRCKHCEHPIAVPAGRADDDEDDERVYDPKGKAAPRRRSRDDEDDDRAPARRGRDREAEDDDEPRRSPKDKKSGMLGILLLAGGSLVVLGFLGLAVIGVIWWVVAGGGNGEVQQNAVAANNGGPGFFVPPQQGGQPPFIIVPDNAPGGNAGGPAFVVPNNDVPAAAAQIDPATRNKVKDATVYLEVVLPNGGQASGSGFFAIEPGIVITNAHVLGMLQAQSKPPASVDVVVHSGEPGEKHLNGSVIGVDRDTDLAVVRVNDAAMPPPLPVHTAATLQPLQEVYFFGYPYGKKLGTEVSINRANVSSLRKGTNGALAQVQLTGDMQPGNSGGPVVDKDGRVVGIAVAIIRNTRINFAVPADLIKPILDGRIEDSTYGDPFVVNNEIKLPVKFQCLDPLHRVKAVRVEVWTGPQGAPRPIANEPPAPFPGDGPRKTVTINYQNGVAAAEIGLPTVPPGQVYWLQPVIVNGAGTTQWHTATPREAAPPLQRVAAELRLRVDAVTQNTVKINDTLRMTFREGKREFSEALHLDVTLLETVCPINRSTNLGLSVGPNRFTAEEAFGKQNVISPNYSERVRKLGPPPNFIIDRTGRMLVRSKDPILNPNLPKMDHDHLDMMYHRICEAFQQTLMVLPNRQLQPLESFQAIVPTLVGRNKDKKQLDLRLTCTYLGSRVFEGRNEAVISLDGTAHLFEKGKGPQQTGLGNVVGRAVLDLDQGQFSQISLRLWTELDLNGQLQMVRSETISLTRVPGNVDNIAETAPRPPKGTQDPPNTPRTDAGPPVVANKTPPLEPKTPPIEPKTSVTPKPAPMPMPMPMPMPPPKTDPPPPVVKPKVNPVPAGGTIVDVKAALTNSDFLGGPRGRKHKTYDVKMEEGRTYVIEMKAIEPKGGIVGKLNPFLQLLDPAKKEVAKDDDGAGGKDAKITYTATKAGTYQVVATTLSGIQVGAYHLAVTAKD